MLNMNSTPSMPAGNTDRVRTGWLLACWLLLGDAQSRLTTLRAHLQQSAARCSEEAAAGGERTSDLVCGAWAADMAARMLGSLHADLMRQAAESHPWFDGAIPRHLAARTSDCATRSQADLFVAALMADPSRLWELLEELGFVALWLHRTREGVALVNGAATLRAGPIQGALAEAAALGHFGHDRRAADVLSCAKDVLTRNGTAEASSPASLSRLITTRVTGQDAQPWDEPYAVSQPSPSRLLH